MLYSNEYAQQEAALYEQFLNSLQAYILAFHASGAKVSGKVLEEASKEFDRQCDVFRFYHNQNFNTFVDRFEWNDLGENIYDDIVGEHEVDTHRLLRACIMANKETFLSALRFGGAFGGFSDYLKDMHGNVGLLVQQKSQDIRWNVRLSDGRTVSSVRALFVQNRHFAYRYEIYSLLGECLKNHGEDAEIYILDKNQDIIHEDTVGNIIKSKELVDKFFHYNSKNELEFLRNYAV